MVYRSDIFSDELFAQRLSEGYVTERLNDAGTLAIANYTPKAQYDRLWDEVTSACRGLIYDVETKEIVARPFPKFKNWDESGVAYPPPGPVLRMPKMDGSLGILYFDSSEDAHKMATRGSMNSEQAQWASEFYDWLLFDMAASEPNIFQPIEGKTYLFEIIYPENRIVVNYGDQKRLTLLDVIDNETGFPDTDEFENCYWHDKVERVLLPGFDSGQVVDIPEGEEGFVYLWPARNFRTKMKSSQYVELHRIIFNLTPKNIWRAIVAGKTLDQIKEPFPDEFYDEIEEHFNSIYDAYGAIADELMEAYSSIPPTADRKSFAAQVKKHPRHLQGLLFAVKDMKPTFETIMRMVEPKGDKPRMEEE